MSDDIYEEHTGQHQNCPTCFSIKCRTMNFQGPGAGDRRRSEKERSRDMREYQTLRRQGYQPRNIFGSAEVAAQAGSTFEVEHHVVMAPGIRKEMNAMIEEGNAITRGEA